MATLQDLDRRIRSVTNTRKITKAMEMVAAAKLRRAQLRIEHLRPFADSLVELTALVANGIQSGAQHSLLEERDVTDVCIVLFTGDRGLAGALNSNALKRALLLAKEWEEKGANVRWIGVGKKGVSSLQFRGIKVDQAFRGITDAPKFRDAERVGRSVIKSFDAGDYDRVIMVYNHFETAVTQDIVVQQMLPIDSSVLEAASKLVAKSAPIHHADEDHLYADPSEAKRPHPIKDIKNGHDEHPGHTGHKPDWVFEPDTQTLLNRLLPTYVEQSVFRALLESTASEHGARMSAMRNASENAGDIIDSVTLQRNRARQASITQEILEVVGGAEALN